MRAWSIASLALLLLSAAATPPGPCGPAAFDLVGGPPGEAAPGVLAPPGFTAAGSACENIAGQQPRTEPLSSANRLDDVVHSLPSPDALRQLDQPRRAPDFR
jgi:hypothetical protein